MQIASVSNLWLHCGALMPVYFMISLIPRPSHGQVFDLQVIKSEGLESMLQKQRVGGGILFPVVSETLQGRV